MGLLLVWATLLNFCLLATGNVVQLDIGNIDSILKSNDVVFVNFYAEWCRFSQMLKPIYAEAAEKFTHYPPGKIVWASVDSDQQAELAQRYSVNKYPTLKLFRKGELVKKEYRSQRSAEALTSFIQKQLDSGVQQVDTTEDLAAKLDKKKRNVIGYFSQAAGTEFEAYNMVASVLRDECAFHLAVGAHFQSELQHGSKIIYEGGADKLPEVYDGALSDFDAMKRWLTERCVPLVREITFENAEELTEEGLPFLILFKHPDDTTTQQIFTEKVLTEIPDQKASINCLVADGKKFAHPLHHLGKAESDLPVIAIDSFRHMYLFSKFDDIHVPGKLRQFVMDLHSGKLHREFHHGPDPAQANHEHPSGSVPQTQPPPSVFEKLKPSHNRYSLLEREEL